MRSIILLSLLFCSPYSLACGGWNLTDFGEEHSVSFLVNSISIKAKDFKLDRAIRSDGENIFFHNGDQAHLKDNEIVYWKRNKISERKWIKKKIGSLKEGEVSLENLGTLKINIATSAGPSSVTIHDQMNKKIIEGKISAHCEGRLEREKKRLIAYLIWKSQKPDLTKKAKNWWW